MSKFLWIILITVAAIRVEAKPGLGLAVAQKTYALDIKPRDTTKRTAAVAYPTTPKFIYAELLYQRQYGDDKLAVNSNSVSEALKKMVAFAKYRDTALELLGAEGWELTAAVNRELSAGYEILFYLKKKME